MKQARLAGPRVPNNQEFKQKIWKTERDRETEL